MYRGFHLEANRRGRLSRRIIEGRFDGGNITRDAGVMFLAALGRRLVLIDGDASGIRSRSGKQRAFLPERLTEQYCDLAAIEKLAQLIRLSKDKTKPRHERLPQPSFSDALPIANRRAEIQAATAANQVVIVCGETGSGRTTPLPNICLELKRGIYGTIGCIQPRDQEFA